MPKNPITSAMAGPGSTFKYINAETAKTDRLKVVVVGKPGVGKTSLLRTIPEKEKVFTLSAEGGLLSVRDMVQTGKVEGIEVSSNDDFLKVYEGFRSGAFDKYGFEWIFVDSLTEISNRCLDLSREHYDFQGSRINDNIHIYGEYNSEFSKIMRGFRDLNKYHVVFTCLELENQDQKRNRYTELDIEGPKPKQRIPALFDEIFNMSLLPDGKRVFRTRLPVNFTYVAKDRSGKLNDVEPANLGYIRDKILA
jgi:hypothetical protein